MGDLRVHEVLYKGEYVRPGTNPVSVMSYFFDAANNIFYSSVPGLLKVNFVISAEATEGEGDSTGVEAVTNGVADVKVSADKPAENGEILTEGGPPASANKKKRNRKKGGGGAGKIM